MIVQESFLKKLRSAFDLNIYEVKIWTALLSRGVASAGELADISGVPRSRSYDVLESLEKKGFVIMKLGKPIKYLAVKPEEVVKRVKKTIEDRAGEQLQDLETVKDTQFYKEIELLHKHGIEKIDPADMSGIIKGRKNIYDHLKSMISNAQDSVTIVTSQHGLLRKHEALKSALKKAKDRGVTVKIAASNIAAKDLPEDMKSFAEVRNLTGQKARFVIADSNQMLFMLNNDDEVHETYDLGVWVNTPFFANAMEQMFNVTWGKLKPLS